MTSFKDRLDKILDRLMSEELLSNAGLGNEIGFYIFDYPPEHELEVREHIQFLLRQLPKRKPHLRFTHIHLFELMISCLKKRKYLEKAFKMQAEKGG